MSSSDEKLSFFLEDQRFGIFGTTEDGRKTIRYRRELNHPADKVWRAITEKEELAAWFPELNLTQSKGGEAVLNFSGGECPPPESNPSDIDYCTVTEFEPPLLLEYAGPTEEHRWEITPDGDKCTLVFITTLPLGERIQNSVACGWHYKIDVMELSLGGTPVELEGFAGPTLTSIYFEYRKKYGKEDVRT